MNKDIKSRNKKDQDIGITYKPLGNIQIVIENESINDNKFLSNKRILKTHINENKENITFNENLSVNKRKKSNNKNLKNNVNTSKHLTKIRKRNEKINPLFNEFTNSKINTYSHYI